MQLHNLYAKGQKLDVRGDSYIYMYFFVKITIGSGRHKPEIILFNHVILSYRVFYRKHD